MFANTTSPRCEARPTLSPIPSLPRLPEGSFGSEHFRQNHLIGLRRAAEALGYTLTSHASGGRFRVRACLPTPPHRVAKRGLRSRPSPRSPGFRRVVSGQSIFAKTTSSAYEGQPKLSAIPSLPMPPEGGFGSEHVCQHHLTALRSAAYALAHPLAPPASGG